MNQPPSGEKLQKILARTGVGSRRAMEKVIEEGRVSVNGVKAKLGDRATEADKIQFDGKAISGLSQPVRVIIYNKPEGQVCTRNDEQGRETVFKDLPVLYAQRWINVGRLDINTSGLLLFTTDGELANKLMHPSTEIDREYLVRVFGEVTDENIKALKQGVELEDGLAKFTDITEKETQGSQINKWFTVCLKEGRNREVRRLWESQGVKVNRLKRVRYGPVFLPSIARSGDWIDMPSGDIKALYKLCGMHAPDISMKLPDQKNKARRQEQKLRSRGRH